MWTKSRQSRRNHSRVELHDLIPWRADTVSAPKIDEKELLSTTLNLSDVGTSLRTPRDSGTSPTSQFLERDGVDDVLQTRDDENIKAEGVSNQNKNRNQQSNKLKKVNSALKQSPKSTNTSGKNQRKSKRKFKGKSKKRSKRPQKPVVLTPEEFNDLYGLGDKIGSGAYGIVYRGTRQNYWSISGC